MSGQTLFRSVQLAFLKPQILFHRNDGDLSAAALALWTLLSKWEQGEWNTFSSQFYHQVQKTLATANTLRDQGLLEDAEAHRRTACTHLEDLCLQFVVHKEEPEESDNPARESTAGSSVARSAGRAKRKKGRLPTKLQKSLISVCISVIHFANWTKMQ
jgi:hypothetical protein